MAVTYIDKDYEKYICKIPTGPIEEDNKIIKIVEIDDNKYKEEDNLLELKKNGRMIIKNQ